jgi:hypothetical protein
MRPAVPYHAHGFRIKQSPDEAATIITRHFVWGHFVPGQQVPSHVFVNRHQLSRCFRFDWAHVLVHQRPGHAHIRPKESVFSVYRDKQAVSDVTS